MRLPRDRRGTTPAAEVDITAPIREIQIAYNAGKREFPEPTVSPEPTIAYFRPDILQFAGSQSRCACTAGICVDFSNDWPTQGQSLNIETPN